MSQNGIIPKYRLHKASGRAVVTLDGRDIYVGRYGTDTSKAEYDRLIRRWLGNGRLLPAGKIEAGPTVAEIILPYWKHAKGYYRKGTAGLNTSRGVTMLLVRLPIEIRCSFITR